MNLFEFKLEIMTPVELKKTITSLKERLRTSTNKKERETILKMIEMTEEKLRNHKSA